MTTHHRWWRRLVATAVTTLAVVAGLAVTAAPAHAGQVGATVTLSGRGWIEAVEGRSPSDLRTCSNEQADRNDQSITCQRWRTEATFEASIWFRAHPGIQQYAGDWVLDRWEGCDRTRLKEGFLECGVSSGAFSSDEKAIRVVFTDSVAPHPLTPWVTTRPGVDRTVDYDLGLPDEGARLECRFDDAPYVACPRSGSRQLPEGAHTLAAVAVDPSGNTSAPGRHTFLVVDTRVDSGPAALTSSGTAEFRVSSGAGTRFVCSLETFPEPVGCAQGSTSELIRFSGLPDGPHVLTVAAERDGWKDPVPATYEWTVDTVGPTTRIGLDNVVGNTDVRVGVSASEPSTSECRVTREGGQAGSWATCLQDINSFPGLTSGTYLFEARSTDAAGNTGATASYRHVVDEDGPTVTITPSIDGTSATFVIAAPEARRIDCIETHLGVARRFACTPTVTMTGLAIGEHRLEVRALDGYDNYTTPGAVYSWRVSPPVVLPPDVLAPETSLTGGPAEGSIVLTSTAVMAAAASEPATFVCTLDGAPQACPGGQLALTGLGAGRHTATVAAVDTAGNRDLTPATRSWSTPVGSRALVAGRKKAKGFTQSTSATAYAGAEARAKRKGATLTTTVTDARTLALVAAPGRGQGKVTVSLGSRRLATLDLSKGTGSTTLITLPALTTPYSGAVTITSRSRKPVRIQGLGWS